MAFKNCAPFVNYITKIDGTTIDVAEDLDLVMSMYNLLEYSSSYSDKTGSLWFYSKDEATKFNAVIGSNAKTKVVGETEVQATLYNYGILKDTAISMPLKNLSNFWRSLEIPLINCKVELKLKWTNYYQRQKIIYPCSHTISKRQPKTTKIS